MATVHALSEEANRQLREMFRDFYSTYVAPVALRSRWQGSGVPQTCLVKTLTNVTAPKVTECAVYTGALGSETLNGDEIVGYARSVDIDSGIWCEAMPLASRKGAEAGGGTSSVSTDGDHPDGTIGPATYELAPWGCNA